MLTKKQLVVRQSPCLDLYFRNNGELTATDENIRYWIKELFTRVGRQLVDQHLDKLSQPIIIDVLKKQEGWDIQLKLVASVIEDDGIDNRPLDTPAELGTGGD